MAGCKISPLQVQHCIATNASIRFTIPNMRIDETNGLEEPKYTVSELGDFCKLNRRTIAKLFRDRLASSGWDSARVPESGSATHCAFPRAWPSGFSAN
jgi:hypothetical protein